MDVARPHAAISPSLEGEVLVTLARTRQPLTGREIARLVAWGSQTGVNLALARLRVHGIVDAQEAGRALLYTLNREHLAAPAVEWMRDLRISLIRALERELRGWKPRPAHASLFGSSARGDGDTASDIDLFLVRPKAVPDDDRRWGAQAAELARQVKRWTGNPLSIAEVSATELPRLRRTRAAIARELEKDAVTLCGPAVATLLRGHR